MDDFFEKHGETGQLVMLLQEEIIFEEYYRCYCIGGKYVRIMPYEPRNPHHLRYEADFHPVSETIETNGRDRAYASINTSVMISIQWNWQCVMVCHMQLISAIPAPDAEVKSVGEENFEWVVETAANYAIERAHGTTAGKR